MAVGDVPDSALAVSLPVTFRSAEKGQLRLLILRVEVHRACIWGSCRGGVRGGMRSCGSVRGITNQ